MKTTVTTPALACDGCQYLMSAKHPRVEVTVPFDFKVEWMRADRTETFHFHAHPHRHDCFRYWAHNPQVMRRSLEERDWSEEQIDDFMSMMLYRTGPFNPGIERPKEKIA